MQMAVQAMKAARRISWRSPSAAPTFWRAFIARSIKPGCQQIIDLARRGGRIVADLTPRQHQIMSLVVAGEASKNIAIDLGISQRTVENHRAAIMKRTGSKSLPALARMALAVSSKPLA